MRLLVSFLLTALILQAVTPDQKLSGPEIDQLIRRLHRGVWPERKRALDELMPYISQSQAAQTAVIDICLKLGGNPDWEDDNFIYYFDEIGHAVGEIAEKKNDPSAWKALALSSYNPDSPYARWLSTQQGAIRVLIRELDDTKYPIVQGNAAYVVALSMAEQKYGCNNVQIHFSTEERTVLIYKIFRFAETNPGNDGVAYAQSQGLLGMEFIDSPERQDVLQRIEKNGSRDWVRDTAHKIEGIPEEQVRKDACQAVKSLDELFQDR